MAETLVKATDHLVFIFCRPFEFDTIAVPIGKRNESYRTISSISAISTLK
jgi:hypothetical protein